ncbi:MAG: hypothetical protein V4632_19065 [Pseudomonadota bacterium]
MPEQISKYPEVTINVLKGAGAVCGEGAPQNILVQCPPQRFCSLPTGEMCIYGIDEIPQMTQIKMQELAAVVIPKMPSDSPDGLTQMTNVLILIMVFLAGVVLGRIWQWSRMRASKRTTP